MSSIARKLDECVTQHSQAIAIETDDVSLNWAELGALSFKMSRRLRNAGVKKGDHVALFCGNRAAFLISWFAIANRGAVTVCVNTGLVSEGFQYAITQSKCSYLLVDDALYPQVSEEISSLPPEVQVIRIEDDRRFFQDIQQEEEDDLCELHGSDPVTLIYTSGTTGRPKGVMNCHQAYIASGERMVDALRIRPEERIMIVLPLFHANPQIYAVMSTLLTGCTMVVRPKFSASRFFEDARQFKATMFTYVGTILAMIAARVPEGDTDHTLDRCVGGGCSEATWLKLQESFGIKPFELYGMSETAGWASANSFQDYRIGSCGKVRDDLELVIVDKEDSILPAGESGEIALRPRLPFRLLMEYWDNPVASCGASRNFWFHTGDIGRFDEDGFLYFLGRDKEIIRKGGENISPIELEQAMLEFPKIRDVAVVAVPDSIMGDEIKACIVAEEQFSATELQEFLSRRIPKFMFPRYLQFLQQIPRTETEKIKRNLLQENHANIIDAQKP